MTGRMDDRSITVEDHSQILEPKLAGRTIDLIEGRGGFAIDHAFFKYAP